MTDPPFTITTAQLISRREALGLSPYQLAEALGLAHATVWRWEHGERAIQTPRMLDLALQTLERKHRQQADTPESVERKMESVDSAIAAAMRHLL